MLNSTRKLTLGPNSLHFTETKSPRGSRQNQQGSLQRSAFQHAQGKSRVVTKRRAQEVDPFAKEVQPLQSNPGEPKAASDSAVRSSADGNSSIEVLPSSQRSLEGEKRAQLYRRFCPVGPDISQNLAVPIEKVTQEASCDSARSGSGGRHIARLPTLDLIEQVDERNHKIEELLRMGEATIAESGMDTSPLSKAGSYTESEDGESPNKRAERASWEVLDLAADGVLKSLDAKLHAIAELSDHSASSSTRSQSSEDEFENIRSFKRSGSNESNGSQGTVIYTGVNRLMRSMEQLVAHKQCKVGHDLKPHLTPSNRWWCSKCFKQVSEGTQLFGCRIYNYDECKSCLGVFNAEVQEDACQPCSGNDMLPQEVLREEVLHEEVVFLQQQMAALQSQLCGVIQERDEAVSANRQLESHVSKMWKATLSYSDFNPGK